MSTQNDSIAQVEPTIHRLLAASFAVYLTLLVWLVVWKLQAPHLGDPAVRPFKLLPFGGDGTSGSSSPRDVIGNLLIFLPFGILLGILAPSWGWIRLVATFALASLALESAQWVLAVGSFDTSDIIMNTVGGALGLFLLALAGGRADHRTG